MHASNGHFDLAQTLAHMKVSTCFAAAVIDNRIYSSIDCNTCNVTAVLHLRVMGGRVTGGLAVDGPGTKVHCCSKPTGGSAPSVPRKHWRVVLVGQHVDYAERVPRALQLHRVVLSYQGEIAFCTLRVRTFKALRQRRRVVWCRPSSDQVSRRQRS